MIYYVPVYVSPRRFRRRRIYAHRRIRRITLRKRPYILGRIRQRRLYYSRYFKYVPYYSMPISSYNPRYNKQQKPKKRLRRAKQRSAIHNNYENQNNYDYNQNYENSYEDNNQYEEIANTLSNEDHEEDIAVYVPQ